MMNAELVLLTLSVALVLYFIFIWFLNRLLQPLRLSMVEQGTRLLYEDRLPEQYHSRIKFMMKISCSAWGNVILIIALFLAAIQILCNIKSTGTTRKEIPRNLVKKYDHFDKLFTISVLFSNVWLAPVVVIEALFFGAIVVLYKSIVSVLKNLYSKRSVFQPLFEASYSVEAVGIKTFWQIIVFLFKEFTFRDVSIARRVSCMFLKIY